MLLIVHSFAISPQSMERAQILVQGMELTVFTQVVTLVARVLYLAWVKGASRVLEVESAFPNGAVSA